MEGREKDIIKVCEQVQGVLLDVNQNNWWASCPFCSNGKHGAYTMADVEHEQDCAYLIAKDLMAATASPKKG